MSSLGRSVFALVARRAAFRPASAAAPQLASSFASSSRVRLDSPSPSSSSPSSPTSTSASATDAPVAPPPIAPLINNTPRASKSKYRIPPVNRDRNEASHTLTVSATRNNTVLTFADKTGPIFPTISAGTDKGFKNSQRASYEAAHQAALKMFGRIEEYSRNAGRTDAPAGLTSYTSGIGNRRLKVVFKGLRGGQGREAVAAAIAGQEGDGVKMFIGRVEDRTGIKIGGTKGKRVRRL